MAADSPIIGHGPNAYAVESPQYRSELDASVMGFDTSNDPHSVPLAFLTSAGALGLLGFLILFGWTAWRWRTVSEEENPDLLAVAFAGGAAAYFVQSMVAVDELTVRFALWLCIGALGAAGLEAAEPLRAAKAKKVRKTSARQVPQLRKVPLVGAAGALAALGAVWGLNLLLNDASFRHAKNLATAGRAGDARDEFASVGGAGVYHYRHNGGFYLGRLALAFHGEERPDVAEEFLNEALDSFSYLENFPSVPGWRDRSALLLAYSRFDASYRDEAIESYAHTVMLDPHNAPLQAEAAAASAPPPE
jgi:tetratricopeptide (TPR) repeat protein